MSINRDKVTGEALFILKSLKDNVRLGRSNKLAEVKASLEPSVSLEFDSYFFFLRKFHYIAMDREAQLKLTEQGDRVAEGEQHDRFAGEIDQFFSEQVGQPDEHTHSGAEIPAPPPPPIDDELERPSPGARPTRKGLFPAEDVPVSAGSLFGTRADPHEPPRRAESFLASAPPVVPPVAPLYGGSPAAAAGAKGTDIDLRYVKFDPLGSGPLGTVFKGRHNALGLDVCVKELKDIFGYFSFLQRGEVIKRLKRELCAQAQVRHPGVVAVLDQNTEVARPYFVMELCRGSLREKLDAAGGKGVPVPHAVRYFLQLAYALRAAHASGLTHNNLKPENVLFDPQGNAKVGDFGLGRVIEVDQSKGMPQVFVGTGGMGYMAPELIARSKDVGTATDVYGLGILLYEMLTGQIPGRRSPMPSEVNPNASSKLDPIFDKMTQDRRDARYPDLDAMLDDFYGAFSDGEYLGKGDLLFWSDPPRG